MLTDYFVIASGTSTTQVASLADEVEYELSQKGLEPYSTEGYDSKNWVGQRIRQSPKAYWESAGLWDIYVEITHNGKLVASGSFDVETGEMGRNIYIYTPV